MFVYCVKNEKYYVNMNKCTQCNYSKKIIEFDINYGISRQILYYPEMHERKVVFEDGARMITYISDDSICTVCPLENKEIKM